MIAAAPYSIYDCSFAVTLYEKIHELEEKKQSLVEEANSKGTPAEEREKLLKQVE